MLTTIEGVYENGRVELADQPPGIDRAKVYVTFVAEPPAAEKRTPAATLDEWLAFLREGLALGGPPYPKRDALYDRGL